MIKKKILWIAHEGSMSGAIISMMECIRLLKREGYEQFIISPIKGDLKKVAQNEQIPFYVVPSFSWAISNKRNRVVQFILKLQKSICNIPAIYSIKNYIYELKPDVVISNTISTNVGALAAKKVKKSHYWFVREFGEDDHGFKIAGNTHLGIKHINSLSEKVLFNSLATKNKFSPYIDQEKIYVVYNAVEVAELTIPILDNSVFNLLMLGQIAPSKNHKDAILALALCKKNGMRFHLSIVGKCDLPKYKNELFKLIAELNLNSVISICDHIGNVTEIIQECHALLLCSRMEAFGRVTVEAIKCGVPVIAANSGGSIEIIEVGENGYLYEPNNIEDLSEKIELLKNTYSFFDRKKMSETIREKFNSTKTLKQLIDVLK